MEKFIENEDCKGLKMEMISIGKDGSAKFYSYGKYENFNDVFNAMPKGKSLNYDVTSYFSKDKDTFILVKNFDTEMLEDYKDFVKYSFEKIKTSKNHYYFTQIRKTKDSILTIIVEKR